MRNIVCWLIVAILTLQVSLTGFDTSNEENRMIEEENGETVNFAGRQSNGMNGNSSGGPDCNFTNWQNSVDGLGGPVWQNNTNYTINSIVEWPANSGEFYQTQINSSGGSVEEGHWLGPCTCSEIGEFSSIIWDSSMNYDAWQIVHHDGAYWIAQDAGTLPGDEPEIGNDNWVECTHEDSTPCDELIGINTGPWDSTMLVSEGEIYEYPANSSNFYMVSPFINNQAVGEPGVDLDAWDEEYCDCKDIWSDSGEPVWDSTASYPSNSVIEWPAGSDTLYIAWAEYPVDPPNETSKWRLCDGEAPSGGPCEEFNGYGGMTWDSTMLVSEGEIYEYPANSDLFYLVSPGISSQTVGAPGYDLDAWSEKYCDCDDIWMAAGSPVWDSNTVYSAGMMVEYPANTGDIWMAIVSQTTTGVTPDQPFADGNEWELCGGEEPSDGPCGGLTSVGVWDDLSRVSTGEIYEYPAGSGDYYEVIFQGVVDQEVSSPLDDNDMWGPVDCPCEEEWMAAGSPVWDSSTTYPTNSVVEWPAGSMMLYIAWASPGPGDEPDTDPEWELCSSPDDNSTDPDPSGTTPCAGLSIVGVWDSSMTVSSGEIYEYPANSGSYYLVNAGGPFTNMNAPDVDMDVWTPTECPCKETWVANGQPVWGDPTTDAYYPAMHPINYVVEYPANSGILYINTVDEFILGMSTEPGVDENWVLCDGQEPNQPSSYSCAGLDVLGVWDSTVTVSSGEVYEYPANSDTYYQVNQGGPFTNVNAPDIDMDVWSPIDCPCKETWVANNQPVWDASVEYPGNYVVEWPAGTSNLYIPLEPTGVGIGAEPGVDIHWVLCAGEGPSPGPCDGLNVPVWDNSTAPAVGDIYEFPANSGTYYQIIFVHEDANGGPDWVADPTQQTGDEFWVPYSCPCKTTWVANGQPVWDDTITFYSGNYVVEWPANSGALYISEGGGLTGSVEPGTDGHWIPCEGNPELEAEDEAEAEDDSIPSIGVALTLVGIFSAAAFIGRTKIE
ncbi:MAG: hypothetical protein L7S49_02060 [Candidatus Poseidoniaceae archaeon]|nr:hypothetical protein [Candidatus Poseidoniaceae archaeon]